MHRTPGTDRTREVVVVLPLFRAGYIIRRISGKVSRDTIFGATSFHFPFLKEESKRAEWLGRLEKAGRVTVAPDVLSAPSPLTPSVTVDPARSETDTLGPINSTSKLPL